ncbi:MULTISPECIES: hypothetical protein [unclassified Streptomyces]|uniref:hypothetical protein n=1 Tax=unclassified Streptomyces TaxID=2593676 RepID=UPI00070D3381|nr:MULTISPECIES: hypothetical protein [unclassified Streptomyces]KRD16973.1 hypothetical protein ASE41_23945 [Streptomyces sp. Root264]
MASRAFSEHAAPTASVRIPALPGLGTTWYQRGARYWLRRFWTAVLLLAVLAFLCFASISLYRGFRTVLPPTARTVWDWAQIAASCVAVVWGWLVQRRRHRKDLQDPPDLDEFRARKRDETRRSTGLAFVGRALVVIAAPVMPALAAFSVGWSVGMLTVREYPSEVGARRWMAQRI